MKKFLSYLLGGCLLLLLVGWLALYSTTVQDWLTGRVIRATQATKHHELFNKDAMHVLLCGTGSPIYSPKRASACTAVFAGGHFLLFDVGTGAWKNISLWKLQVNKLGAIFLTHFHSDHITDLGEAVMQTWIAGRKKPLPVYGPKGVSKVVQGYSMAYQQDASYRIKHHGFAMPPEGSKSVARPFELSSETKPKLVWKQGKLRVLAFLVKHSAAPAVGYRVEYGDRSIVISGDTAPMKSFAIVAKDVDILLHEAIATHMIAFANKAAKAAGNKRMVRLTDDVVEDHTTPVQAAQLANQAGAKLLVYTHVVPPPDNFMTRRIFLRGVSNVRSKGVALGEDGYLFTLPLNSKEIKRRSLR